MEGTAPPVRTKPVLPFVLREGVSIIAELKQKSPSAGAIGAIDDERIAVYSRHAAAISVLTDATYFGGSFNILADAARKATIPVLCKDFIIHERQIDMAYGSGADLVLLIVRILDDERLRALYRYARSLGLDCLVEVHTKEELDRAAALEANIIGVNARDLDTLQISLDRAEDILSHVNAPVRVAESGIKTRSDIERFAKANCFLIGETLMRCRGAEELEKTFQELVHG